VIPGNTTARSSSLRPGRGPAGLWPGFALERIAPVTQARLTAAMRRARRFLETLLPALLLAPLLQGGSCDRGGDPPTNGSIQFFDDVIVDGAEAAGLGDLESVEISSIRIAAKLHCPEFSGKEYGFDGGAGTTVLPAEENHLITGPLFEIPPGYVTQLRIYLGAVSLQLSDGRSARGARAAVSGPGPRAAAAAPARATGAAVPRLAARRSAGATGRARDAHAAASLRARAARDGVRRVVRRVRVEPWAPCPQHDRLIRLGFGRKEG